MAGLDMTSFAAALKQHYVDFTVKNMVYKNNALHAILPKDEKFGGKNLPLPLIYGNPQGRSATFANALAQKTNSQLKEFLLTRVKDYSLANIDNETLEASQGDSDAFMKASTTEIDGAFQSIIRSLAQAEYRSGTGSIGAVGSFTATVVTLSNANDVVNFEVGQTVQVSATDGGAARTGSVVITAIDRSAGTLTSAGWAAGIAAIANNDFIFVAGDLNKKISGLAAWIPYVAPGATAFFGVDRTSDVTRLAGQRKDLSSLPIEEGLVDLSAVIGREGGSPDNAFMNTQNFANLEKALGSKVQYVNVSSADVANIGFSGIKIQGNKGPISVIADHNSQPDLVHMLQLDTWKLYSLGMAPKLLKTDGLEFLRLGTDDAVEIRVGYYAQMGCVGPGWNGVGKLQ